jgi:hypothetical protein
MVQNPKRTTTEARIEKGQIGTKMKKPENENIHPVKVGAWRTIFSVNDG